MARPRIKQFAGDMGISYDEANNLIKKSRGRRDGGSQVLESNMNKMRGYESGGTKKMELPQPKPGVKMKTPKPKPGVKMKLPKPKPKMGDLNEIQAMEDVRKTAERNAIQRPTQRNPIQREMGGTVYAEDGKYMSCRGMGAAIKGGKFSGCK